MSSVLEFLHSPYWLNPISGFIDHNCAIFDHEEESSHQLTLAHKEYQSALLVTGRVFFRCGFDGIAPL